MSDVSGGKGVHGEGNIPLEFGTLYDEVSALATLSKSVPGEPDLVIDQDGKTTCFAPWFYSEDPSVGDCVLRLLIRSDDPTELSVTAVGDIPVEIPISECITLQTTCVDLVVLDSGDALMLYPGETVPKQVSDRTLTLLQNLARRATLPMTEYMGLTYFQKGIDPYLGR